MACAVVASAMTPYCLFELEFARIRHLSPCGRDRIALPDAIRVRVTDYRGTWTPHPNPLPQGRGSSPPLGTDRPMCWLAVTAIELERVSDIIASAIIACVLPVRTRIREDPPPLRLWERSDRIARCDPGEGYGLSRDLD